MSHYKPYPAYRDSGVEWIGRVPEHWTVCKLNFRYSVELGKMLDQKKITGEHLIPYLRNQDVQWGTISSDDLPLIDISPDEYDRYTAVDGDLLVCEGGDVGRAAIWRGAPIGYQKALHRLRPRGRDHTQFMHDLLIAAKAWGVFLESDSKSTISHLPAEAFRTYRFPFPPLAEQQSISSTLDREIARIDGLIAMKTRFIELLKKKIAALASQPPDSADVRWIRLSHVCEVISRPVLQQAGSSYIKLGLFNRGRGIFKRDDTDTEDMGDSDFFWIQPGDLILSGQFAWEGAVALAYEEHAECVVSHRFPVIRGRHDRVLTEYLFAYFLTHHGDFVLNDCSRGSAGRNRPLNMGLLLGWKIPIPSAPIQREVARLVHLERKIGASVTKSVALLKERRSALITAAVTGQIDLREAA
mgnify:CR=1 FL=1